MKISASGGDKTTVETTGSCADCKSSVQGAIDTDGDQDAHDFTKSENADQGQLKSPNKMTK